ncbi:SRPBCC family protein [Amnibacterium endophyticum]|uniref:SRPBCC family protein n=1 Tax=Amnibacterium endophyticum TaxID=2109337 RepID=A0ABW4LE37_9MICO
MPLIERPRTGPSATALARSPLPPERLLPLVADHPLPRMFDRWGPFPAVERVDGQDGAWDAVGKSRTLRLGDGGAVTETLVEFEAGRCFAYELTGFSDVFDRLVRGVRGDWGFEPDGTGTIARWTWEFAPRFGRGLLVRLVVAPLWRINMQRMMTAAVRELSR